MRERYSVRHGGLMRCCLLVIDDAMVLAKDAPQEGQRVQCKYCSTPIIFRMGAWQSDAPPAPVMAP